MDDQDQAHPRYCVKLNSHPSMEMLQRWTSSPCDFDA